MRTTLTIDDDVAVQIERLRRSRDASLKDVINEALRLGVREMQTPSRARKRFRTRTFNMGAPRVSVDNAAEALAYAEGEDFK
jgi:hypothetical protein